MIVLTALALFMFCWTSLCLKISAWLERQKPIPIQPYPHPLKCLLSRTGCILNENPQFKEEISRATNPSDLDDSGVSGK